MIQKARLDSGSVEGLVAGTVGWQNAGLESKTITKTTNEYLLQPQPRLQCTD